jgi:hypothetical protein
VRHLLSKRRLAFALAGVLTAGIIWACAGAPGDPCPTPGATKKLDDAHTYTCQQNKGGHNTWGGY